MIYLKSCSYPLPEMLRQQYKKKGAEDQEGEWLLDIDSKVGNYQIEDLEERRDAKPRVILEATHLCYSVEGVATEVDGDEENQMGIGEGGETTSGGEEIEDGGEGEEGEYGSMGVWNKGVKCLKGTCSCCPCCPSKMDLKLLDDVSMKVEPGSMMALMGPSGAGKCILFFIFVCFNGLVIVVGLTPFFFFLATLMDVIAGRKTGGEITGEILFNGRPRDQFFSRYTGYCEQVLFPSSLLSTPFPSSPPLLYLIVTPKTARFAY